MIHNHSVIVLRLVRAAVVSVCGAVVTFAQLGLPSKELWDGQKAVLWISVVVVAGFICVDAVREVNYAAQAARIRDYDNDLRAILSVVVSEIAVSTGVAWDELAVRYYRRRGGVGWYRLVKVGAVHAGATVLDAQTVIRPGVGVVGTAFFTGTIINVEWRDFVRDSTAQGLAAWDSRSAGDRYGLSWGQMRRSAQPEGMVASPTFAVDGRPDGCILLSGPLTLQHMTKDETRCTLDGVATTLELLGPPPRGWWGAHER